MKKLFLYLLSIILLATAFSGTSFATITPTPTSSAPSQAITTQIDDQINNLKDKIASKVAQLKLVEKRGIIGVVTDSNSTQITLKDRDGNIHFIDVDELTNFDSPSIKNFGISDVTKNMTLGVLGLYNKESRRILARFITIDQSPTFIRGAVAAMDKTNFTLTVIQNNGTQTIVEIEDVTKMTSYSTTGVIKSGFSKIQLGQRVYVVGFPDKQNNKELIASRIIVFPNVPINPAIGTALPALSVPTATPSATPSK